MQACSNEQIPKFDVGTDGGSRINRGVQGDRQVVPAVCVAQSGSLCGTTVLAMFVFAAL